MPQLNALTAEAFRKFREMLEKVAPLPWRTENGYIVDANGMAILGTMVIGDEARERIVGAVLCGISTCGGYQLFSSARVESMTIVDLLVQEPTGASEPAEMSDDDFAEYMSHSDADPGL